MTIMTIHCIAMMLDYVSNSNPREDHEENNDFCVSNDNYIEDDDDIDNADGDDDDDKVNLLSKVFFCILKLPSHSVFFGRNFTSLKPILPCRGFENSI